MADDLNTAKQKLNESGFAQAKAQADRANSLEAERQADWLYDNARRAFEEGTAWDADYYDEGYDDEGNEVGPSAGQYMSSLIRTLGPNDPRAQDIANRFAQDDPEGYAAWHQSEQLAWQQHAENVRKTEVVKQALDSAIARKEQEQVHEAAIDNVMKRHPNADAIGQPALEYAQQLIAQRGAPQTQTQTEQILDESLVWTEVYNRQRKAYEESAKWVIDPSLSDEENKQRQAELAERWTNEFVEKKRSEVPEPITFDEYERREQDKLLAHQNRVADEWSRYTGRDPKRESQRQYKERMHGKATGVGAAFEQSAEQNSRLQEPE